METAVALNAPKTPARPPSLVARLLRAARGVAAPAPAPRPVAEEEPIAVAPAAPVEMTWPALLARCREVVRADCVFAVSGDGLVLGCDGDRGAAEVARVAAHLSRAFDLLDRDHSVGDLPETLCVRYVPEGRWLTAVRISPKDDVVVTIAVIGPYTLVERDRARLRNTFLRLFEAA